MSLSEEIERLSQLHADGQITDEEFTRAKAKLIGGRKSTGVNQWCAYIHFGQLAGYVVPFAGFILPIALWQMKKDESPMIDRHGKSVANWLISGMLYGLICGILTLVVIGVAGLMVLGFAGVAFAILGGLKANEGELWKYPLTIEFLK